MVLTRAALEKMNKEDVIALFVEMQDKLSTNVNQLSTTVTEMNKILERMESQQSIAKTVNNALTKRIVALEKQCFKNNQYTRRECVEIVGIPDNSDETSG